MRKVQLNIKLTPWVRARLRALKDPRTGELIKKGPHIEDLLLKEHGWTEDENMGDEAGVVKDE